MEDQLQHPATCAELETDQGRPVPQTPGRQQTGIESTSQTDARYFIDGQYRGQKLCREVV